MLGCVSEDSSWTGAISQVEWQQCAVMSSCQIKMRRPRIERGPPAWRPGITAIRLTAPLTCAGENLAWSWTLKINNQKSMHYIYRKLRVRELNPDCLRDRQIYYPLYKRTNKIRSKSTRYVDASVLLKGNPCIETFSKCFYHGYRAYICGPFHRLGFESR